MDEYQALLARHASRGVLLDTNMLLLLTVGLYDPAYVERFKRTKMYTVDDCHWLLAFTRPFQRLITTPHILAELSNLAIDRQAGDWAPYLPHMLETLRQAKELYVEKDIVLQREYFPRIGLTDAVIVELARQKQYLVVTDDFPLAGYLQSNNCEVINLNHVRTPDWLSGR